jgi:hypothetical protein
LDHVVADVGSVRDVRRGEAVLAELGIQLSVGGDIGNGECGREVYLGVAGQDVVSFVPRDRLELLVKAGALIAAEIDRLLRAAVPGEDR